jgi:hypothetical protein
MPESRGRQDLKQADEGNGRQRQVTTSEQKTEIRQVITETKAAPVRGVNFTVKCRCLSPANGPVATAAATHYQARPEI